MRLLVTRPQPECRKTAERIRALGGEAVEAPMLETRACAPLRFVLAAVTGLAVTSRRVAGILKEHPQISILRALPVFAVGDRTAAAMTSAGFEKVVSADGDVLALAGLIAARQPEGHLLYPCARDRSGDLEGDLAARGLRCDPVIIYEANPVEQMPAVALDGLRDGDIDGVLIYSRRSAEAFLSALENADSAGLLKKIRTFAISPQAGEPLADYTCVETAAHPTEDALLKLALNSC
ncbi:uroporphyrinogen-III synthase [uncultured Roseibium sp.]|uniref:uroporphyrinogen-III synthase n=1 Tax=uncultured Roseibium sp. TaxID=1936171 RepID=UPI0032165BC6